MQYNVTYLPKFDANSQDFSARAIDDRPYIRYRYMFANPAFHAPSKGSDRSGGTQWRSGFRRAEGSHWLRALPAK